jgi:hypothetical protein
MIVYSASQFDEWFGFVFVLCQLIYLWYGGGGGWWRAGDRVLMLCSLRRCDPRGPLLGGDRRVVPST